MQTESLGSVKIDDIKDALSKLRDDVTEVSFEYVIGSFFPNAYQNMQSLLKDAYTQGYIQGKKND